MIQFPTTAGIYQIRNIINGKVYVGSAVNLYQRWEAHKHHFRYNKHCNKHLQRAWNKYGKENFKFEILESIKDINKIIEKEQYWLDKTKCTNQKYGYNICQNAGNTLGFKFSNKTKKLWSKQRKDRKQTEETKDKISMANRGERNYSAKLNNFQVRIIKSLIPELNTKYLKNKDLAKYFNVSLITIAKIRNNMSWKYI